MLTTENNVVNLDNQSKDHLNKVKSGVSALS